MTPGLRVVTGNKIDWKHNNNQRGPTAFGTDTLESPKQVKDFIHSDTKGGQAIRSELAKEFKGNPEGLKRAENGTGYRAIQIKQSGVLKGTTYLVNGKVHTAGDRAVKANDVMWTYVNPDGHINGNASIRAACDQPGFKEYVPTPSNVSVTPIEQASEQTFCSHQ